MRVVVNALYLRPGKVGGTERYLRELLTELARLAPDWQWDVVVPQEGAGVFRRAPGNVNEHVAPVMGVHRVRRTITEQTWLVWQGRRINADLCWNPGATIPMTSPLPQVTTIHDCQSKIFPEYFGFIERAAIEANVYAAVTRSRVLLVPSEATATDLVALYGADPERLEVTPLAASEAFHPGPDGSILDDDRCRLDALGLKSGSYLLSVAANLPHKNLPIVFEAHTQLGNSPEDPILVWTGPDDPAEVNRLARRCDARVRTLGWLPPADMPALYRGARASVLASSFEGFGLAALETLACGTPLITTPQAAIQEVVGSAALMTEDFGAQALTGAMRRLLSDPGLEADLRRKGPERASRFSWRRCAELSLAAFEQAAYK